MLEAGDDVWLSWDVETGDGTNRVADLSSVDGVDVLSMIFGISVYV